MKRLLLPRMMIALAALALFVGLTMAQEAEEPAPPKKPAAPVEPPQRVVQDAIEAVLQGLIGRNPVAPQPVPQPIPQLILQPILQPMQQPAPRAVIRLRAGAAPIMGNEGGAGFGGMPLGSSAAMLTASFATNEELERLLERADKLVAAGRHDLAPQLWQRVLDECGSTLATQADGLVRTQTNGYQSFRPLLEETERRIAASGVLGLRAYRLQADSQARVLLNNSSDADRERVLDEVVRRFFLCSLGDNANFELACRRLERNEFSAAAKVLMKLKVFPDSDLPREAVAARLAVALGRSGTSANSSEIMAALAQVGPELKGLVEADLIRQAAMTLQAGTSVSGWATFHGSASRTGLSEEPSELLNGSQPTASWDYRPNFPLKKAMPPRANNQRGFTITIINGRQVLAEVDPQTGQMKEMAIDADKAPDLTRPELLTSWKANQWQPTGELLAAGGRAFFKAQDRLVCCDAATGKLVWMGRKTKFPLDLQTEQLLMMQQVGWQAAPQNTVGQQRPTTLTEVRLFGDRVAQAMTIAGDLAVSVEGELDYGLPKQPPKPNEDEPENNVGFGFFLGNGGGQQLTRRNWLTAYDVQTGKFRWQRSIADDNPTRPKGGFLAAPLATQDLLLAPISDDGTISLLAMDRVTGQTKWKTPLCEPQVMTRSHWAPIGLSADDDSVFIATGSGAVFSLNKFSGIVNWAVSYPSKPLNPLDQRMQMQQQQLLMMQRGMAIPQQGTFRRADCSENVAIRVGDLVLIAASDTDWLFALDSRTGALRWEAPLVPTTANSATTSILGVRNNKLWVSGKNMVRRYNALTGRIEFERALECSLGRGLLTPNAVYLPDNSDIVKLNPETGAELGTLRLPLPAGEPVGNLSSDGRKLFVFGPGHVFVWGATQETK